MERFIWPTNGVLLMSMKFTLFQSCRRHAVYSGISAAMLSSARQKELAWRGRSEKAVVLQGSVGWAGGLLPPETVIFFQEFTRVKDESLVSPAHPKTSRFALQSLTYTTAQEVHMQGLSLPCYLMAKILYWSVPEVIPVFCFLIVFSLYIYISV